MADVFEKGSNWMAAQFKASASQLVTIERGAGDSLRSCELLATIGATEVELDDGSGAIIRFKAQDFLWDAADFSDGDGSLMPPKRGDRVYFRQHVYEVIDLDTKNPCWAWSDPYRLQIRVHTKETGRAG